MNLYLSILILYSALLVGLALFISKSVKQASDFFVASRRLGTGLLFSTLLAANIGAGSTVGAAGLGYERGLSAWWWVGSAGIGSLLLAFTVGPRLWKIAAKNHFYTVGDYLEFRYDRRMRVLVACLLWLGALTILAGQLIALAWILEVAARTPKWLGCLLGGMVVTLYYSLGGLISAVWVNTLQLVVKLVGFSLAVPFALSLAGGWGHVQERLLNSLEIAGKSTSYFSLGGDGPAGVLGYIFLLVPSFLVSPGLLQKIYGARGPSVVRLAVLLNALGLLLFAIMPPLMGMVARSSYPDLRNRELALPTVMVNLLPHWLGTLTLAAIFSAEISAADAVLSMLTTSFAKDLMKGWLYPSLSETRLLHVTRLTSVVAGTLGVVVAVWIPTVITALQAFYGLLTVALFVPLVFGLYWKGPSASAALLATGASVPVTLGIDIFTSGKGSSIFPPVACGIFLEATIFVLMTVTDSVWLGKRNSKSK